MTSSRNIGVPNGTRGQARALSSASADVQVANDVERSNEKEHDREASYFTESFGDLPYC